MNNLCHKFKITVPGSLIDDKLFYNYTDYDSSDESKPTYDQTVEKGKAYIRYKHLMRKLSELSVPVYLTVDFETAGTPETVPVTGNIIVGYISIDPFVIIKDGDDPKTPEERIEAACKTLAGIITSAFEGDLTEYTTVRRITDRKASPVVPTIVKAIDVTDEYVTSPEAVPSIVVEAVE